MDNPAPVILFVYNRVDHTKRTVDSLLNNKLATTTKLFIYSDGGKNDEDIVKVEKVRDYIRHINGFEKVEIIERQKNLGLANSVISGVTEIINQLGKVIVLEDDIVTAPTFLNFMNDALIFYESNKSIFSVSGYPYPIKIPDSYKKDVFISYRASSWGWATWKNRWDKVDWDVKDFKTFSHNKNLQIKFNQGGEDLTPMLMAQMKGEIDSWAIRWNYAHYKNNVYCLLPIFPLCKNIGTDKSGTHSSSSQKFDVILDNNVEKINLANDLIPEVEIIERIKKKVKPSFFRYIINKIRG